MASRQLFGGAIVATAPPDLIDASEIRQVPDTQEVLLYARSSVSIVVEILQKVEADKLLDAARFHFDSIAHDNSALSSEVQAIVVIPNDRGDETPSVTRLVGTQRVLKFNRQHPDDVVILMGLYRVQSKAIDLVVTFNVPIQSEDGGAVGVAGLPEIEKHFDTFIRSLRIVDFSLFA